MTRWQRVEKKSWWCSRLLTTVSRAHSLILGRSFLVRELKLLFVHSFFFPHLSKAFLPRQEPVLRIVHFDMRYRTPSRSQPSNWLGYVMFCFVFLLKMMHFARRMTGVNNALRQLRRGRRIFFLLESVTIFLSRNHFRCLFSVSHCFFSVFLP